ncbi:MAG: M48 family metallopeptidase [Defluviitaleaceae bacterium]|nr:M48 family metallopeptidase [Defluviitaleaceae bacterium]MCL2239178.1 M48 family metallopeptidase [Defluviitaleaceae bacterium]
MRIAIIAVFLATTAFGFFLKYLTYSRRNASLPANVRDVFDEESYRKNQAYSMARIGFSVVDGIIGMVFSLLVLVFNVHFRLFEFITGYTGNVYLSAFFILGAPMLAGAVIDQLVGIYETFVIEERYGFNKTTPLTYIVDFFKNLLIGGVIGGGLLALFLLLHNAMGNWVFLAFFFVLLAFQLFMMFISPFMLRIFYKLTPLEEGPLRDKVNALAQRTGFTFKGIYKVDASKRSTKLNAFASGFGKTKTIGLFDTLIEKMTEDEVISVLAHEIGHAKRQHILKRAPLSLLAMGLVLLAAFFVVTMPEISMAFGFAGANTAFGLYVLFILVSPLMLVLSIPANIVSRRFEYEADGFSKELAGEGVAVSALKTLYRESFGNLTPHPFVVMMEHSHPPLTDRVAAIKPT